MKKNLILSTIKSESIRSCPPTTTHLSGSTQKTMGCKGTKCWQKYTQISFAAGRKHSYSWHKKWKCAEFLPGFNEYSPAFFCIQKFGYSCINIRFERKREQTLSCWQNKTHLFSVQENFSYLAFLINRPGGKSVPPSTSNDHHRRRRLPSRYSYTRDKMNGEKIKYINTFLPFQELSWLTLGKRCKV